MLVVPQFPLQYCAGPYTELSSEVRVYVDKKASEVSQDDLSNVFKDSYNRQRDDICDSSVLSAAVVDIQDNGDSSQISYNVSWLCAESSENGTSCHEGGLLDGTRELASAISDDFICCL